MALLDILERFRPAGAPGPAGVAGVPSLDDTGPAAELAPVFAVLEPDLVACAEQVEAAHRAARSRVGAAHDRAAALLAQAHLEAEAARAGAAAAVNDEAAANDTILLNDAREQVARVDAIGRARAAALAVRLANTIVTPRIGDRP